MTISNKRLETIINQISYLTHELNKKNKEAYEKIKWKDSESESFIGLNAFDYLSRYPERLEREIYYKNIDSNSRELMNEINDLRLKLFIQLRGLLSLGIDNYFGNNIVNEMVNLLKNLSLNETVKKAITPTNVWVKYEQSVI